MKLVEARHPYDAPCRPRTAAGMPRPYIDVPTFVMYNDDVYTKGGTQR